MSDLDRELRRLKGRLTRAVNGDDPLKVIAVTREAAEVFDTVGWPDCWTMFQRAEDDAMWRLRQDEPWSWA